MTHAFQVLGQIRARAVLGRAGQILHILLLGYPRPNMLVFALKRKSCTVHVPANRIGHTALTLTQLQILQLGISLLIFIPFAIFVMGSPVKTDYLWASLCLVGAAYFIFRGM